MMELYFKVTAMLVVWDVVCHGQNVPDVIVEQLISRVRELENTMGQLFIKLVEMQNSQTVPTKTSVPAARKRGYVYPGMSSYSVGVSTLLGSTLAGEVGFQVSLSEDVQLGYGMRIPFNIIEENFGEAYSMGAAEFECPVSGTYLFSLNIVCRMGSYLEITVEINNGIELPRYILNTVCDHRKRNIPGGGSLFCGETHNGGTAIVSLNRGEMVTVKKVWPIDDASIIAGEGLSTFSGYLLNAKG